MCIRLLAVKACITLDHKGTLGLSLCIEKGLMKGCPKYDQYLEYMEQHCTKQIFLMPSILLTM